MGVIGTWWANQIKSFNKGYDEGTVTGHRYVQDGRLGWSLIRQDIKRKIKGGKK